MIYFFLFFLGLIFGSLGSVITTRLGKFSLSDIFSWTKSLRTTLKEMTRGRSRCDNCHHTLHSIDLIPLFSYCSTGGKCRYCKKRISPLHILLEIGCGLLFVFLGYVAINLNFSLTHSMLWIIASWLLYMMLVYDIQTMYLHESIRLLSILATTSLIFSAPQYMQLPALIWATIFLGVFLGIYYFAKLYVKIRFGVNGEGFGMGDVRLAPVIGAQFGLLLQRQDITPLINYISGTVITTKNFNDATLFIQYIIIAGVVGLLYAGISAIISKNNNTINGQTEIAFFPGMIIALWITIALATV